MDKKNIIFILCGKAQTGKNKVASIIKELCEENGKKCVNLAYASYLKEYAKNITGWDGKEETKPRDFLQNIGIEIIKKQIDEKMLIRRIIEDIKVYTRYFDIVTISDARFKEEIEDIKEEFEDIVTIHIVSDGNNLTNAQKVHITETALDDYNNYDYEIYNDKIEISLKEKIEKILNEVGINE